MSSNAWPGLHYDDQNSMRRHALRISQSLNDAMTSIKDCEEETLEYEKAIQQLQERCEAAEASYQSEKLRYHYASQEIDRLYSKYQLIQQEREESDKEHVVLQDSLDRAEHRMQTLEEENKGLSETLASAMTLLLERDDAISPDEEKAHGDPEKSVLKNDDTRLDEWIETWSDENDPSDDEPCAKKAKTKPFEDAEVPTCYN